MEGEFSSSAPVLSGVQQGTVIEPLLFLTYINDLPDSISHSDTKLFADDSMLMKEIKTEEDQRKLQSDLAALETWERKWQMNFNPSKCNTMRANGSKEPPKIRDYFLHGQKLENTKSSKYLGVTITEELKWTEHVDLIVAKANRSVGFLRRNFSSCTAKAKSTTYSTMVRPVLEYASSVWDPVLKSDINKIEKVQRSAARYIFNNYKMTPGTVTSLLDQLQWESLEERRLLLRLSMLYKIQNGLVDLNPSNFYKQSDNRTRGKKMFQERTSNPVFTNSFFPRTLSQWNKLPSSLTEAKSLLSFKHGVGRFMRSHTM